MIEIRKISKAYGNQTVLNDVNWTFPDQGLVCLLGASGCGKSTLLNVIAGFDSQYTGDIIVGGVSISNMNETEICEYRGNNIGFVFQNYNLLMGYTVLENILLPCGLNKSSISDKEKAMKLLERLDIFDKKNEKVENLSGGQKQRVAIARALINEPSLILADEPTASLDRKNSYEIMSLLKEISKTHLVLIITHDKKICEFADQVIAIQDKKIVGEEIKNDIVSSKQLNVDNNIKSNAFGYSLKNFIIHLKRHIIISFIISIGVLAFVLSLSTTNIMGKFINDFKDKNTAFNNGYIKADEKIANTWELINKDKRIQNIYKQYIIKDVKLTIDFKTETMLEKYPMPKATEKMSYGVMPKIGENQIALSPSLAKKFNSQINELVGKTIKLNYDGKDYTLSVSGIYNAGYDDFFISNEIEKELYEGTKNDLYSISYDVKDFEDIVAVDQELIEHGIKSETATKEVAALQNTFNNLNKLFMIVSILVLIIGLFISATLLIKLQNSRYNEIGLLSALGFNKKSIRNIIINENILLSIVATVLNIILIGLTYLCIPIFNLDFIMSGTQIILSIIFTGVIIIFISTISSYQLIHTEPAVALRK